MEHLAEELMEQLNVRSVFTLHLGSLDIPVNESVALSWCIILVIFIVSFLLTRNLKIHNISKRQAVMESIVTWLDGFVGNMLGEEAKRYTSYLITVLIYIGICNVIGLIGVKPPTKDLSVTAGLAIMSIILVQIASVREKGVGGWLKSFSQPMPVVTPINILELVIKPLSLCMRLFGNVIGAFVVMELIKFVIPVGVPAVFSLYFDIFDGLLQAYVFVFLTSMYINEAVE